MFASEDMLSKQDNLVQRKKPSPEFTRKFRAFFEETGVNKAWFAKKIGTVPQLIYQVLLGTHRIPIKCWDKTIQYSGGWITLADLLTEKLRENRFFEVTDVGDPQQCEVRMKGSLKKPTYEKLEK